MRTIHSLALVVSLALAPLAGACGTTSEAAPTATKAQASKGGTAQETCVAVFNKNRTCTDDFIPALVDTRAKLDKPAGIRDAVAKDRDGVIAQAKTEWAEDGKDEAIARNCQQITAAMTDPTDAETSHACLAQTECSAFVACIRPLFEKHLSK